MPLFSRGVLLEQHKEPALSGGVQPFLSGMQEVRLQREPARSVTGLSQEEILSIAEEAGIGKGTVYEYFTSREEIISKAMAYRLRGEADALSERVNKAEGFEQKLDTLLCFARDSVQAQASGMKVLFASARTLESPEAVCRHIGDAQVVEQLRAMIARIVESGVREGLLRQPPSEAYALMALAGAVFGYANLQHILPGQDDAALREDARQMVRRALS